MALQEANDDAPRQDTAAIAHTSRQVVPLIGFDEDAVQPPHPVNWLTLSADGAEAEWLELNRWVDWLRAVYRLPVTVVPPLWHRYPDLVWELSALHLHWLSSYYPDQSGSGPHAWHRDLPAACGRLRDRVATSGTRLDRDRPARPTVWPGEEAAAEPVEAVITDREEDFLDFVMADVARRHTLEQTRGGRGGSR